MLALLIFAAIVWTLRRLTRPAAAVASARLKITGVALLALTFVQLYFGALVAGLRAGRVYNTWPDIDGAFIPSAARLFFEEPWWRNLFDNTLTVQFEHRMTAYALLALAVLHAIDAVRSRAGSAVISGAWWLVAAIIAAGDARHPHAAASGADRSRAGASGRRDRGADAGDLSDRTAGRAPRRRRTQREAGSAGRAARLKLNDSNLS